MDRRRNILFPLIALLAVVVSGLVPGKALAADGVSATGKDVDGTMLRTSLSQKKCVIGEVVLYEVTLLTQSPDIRLLSSPRRFNFGALQAVNAGSDSQFSRVKVKGKEYFSAVIARFYLTATEPGRYQLTASEFVVGLPHERVVRDPFFGQRRQLYYEEVPLEAPALSMKVSELPSPPGGFPNSGAVGEYEVSVWIPDGYITAGEDAVAVVSVSGKGLLSDAVIPELKKAFSGSTRLKSVSENRNNFLKDGALCSEIELECTFVPIPDADGKCVIGPVEFGFYSPSAGKYVRTSSSPVEVPFSSSKGSSPPPVEMGV